MGIAVLVIDMQDFLPRPVNVESLLKPLQAILTAARTAGHPIVWVTRSSDQGADLLEPLASMQREHDLRIERRPTSAFETSDLAERLDRLGVDRLVLTGAFADTSIRTTADDARTLGFSTTVVSDAVGAAGVARLRESLASLRKAASLLDGDDADRYRIRSAVEVLTDWRACIDGLGAGDSRVHYGVLPDDFDSAFGDLMREVDWQAMTHRGGRVPRDVAIQGLTVDGLEPLYRHPADEQPPLHPFTPTVDRLRREASVLVGQAFNHVLIQRYSDRASNISLHADKTLDVARGSAIVNFSVGATRRLVLQYKLRRPDGRFDADAVELPHGSLFVLGWETNRQFRHGIRPDRRPAVELRLDERREDGARISLTFRNIATFRTPDGRLTGQGAPKDRRPAVSASDYDALIEAFGRENQDPAFDWDETYGGGFSTINFRTAGR